MELRHLQYFLAVAEELHFGKAAAKLQMTQSPLSQQIQQLEDELDVKLFHRTKRRVELTYAGQTFLPGVRRILQELDLLVEQTQRAHRGESGRLVVGFVGSATYDVLPKILQSYRRKYPHVEVKLIELSTPAQVEALQSGYIDIGILRPPVNHPLIQMETIRRDECVITLPKEHPLAKRNQISMADLSNEQFVLISRDIMPELYDTLLEQCRHAGFNPTISLEAKEFQTVIGLVTAGMGIAVVPTAAQNLQTRDVVYRVIQDVSLTADMAITWRTDDNSPIVKSFIQIARSAK